MIANSWIRVFLSCQVLLLLLGFLNVRANGEQLLHKGEAKYLGWQTGENEFTTCNDGTISIDGGLVTDTDEECNGYPPHPGHSAAVGYWHFLKPKAATGREFEEALKHEINSLHESAWTWEVWQVLTGERSGQYVVATVGHRWEDFDNAASKTHKPFNLGDTLAPYLESALSQFRIFLPAISRPPVGKDRPETLISMSSLHLNIGKEDEFEYALGKISSAIRMTNWPTSYLWYVQVHSGEEPTFNILLPEENWADFRPPEKPFNMMLEEVYGREEARTLVRLLEDAVHCQRSEILLYRPDLSYTQKER